MKLRNFVAAIALFAVMSVSAYDLQAVAEDYKTEVEASIVKMESEGKHNTGAESFKDFIAKFSTDEDFMNERISLNEQARAKCAHLLVPETFTAKMPEIKEHDGVDDVYYQVWEEMQANIVHLNCCWDGVLENNIVFKRVNGKWYLDAITE